MPYRREPLSYKVVQPVATIADFGDTQIELNWMCWGENPAKLDLRKWTNGKPSRGLTLSVPEAVRLRDALAILDLTEGESAGADPAQPPWSDADELRT